MSWRELCDRLGKTESETQERRRRDRHGDEIRFTTGETDLVVNTLPSDAVAIELPGFLDLLRRRFGSDVDLALSKEWTDPNIPADNAPEAIRSPIATHTDSRWLRRTNMVGVNVRTVGTFVNVAKYALTLSRAHDSIHLLPIWEPGVVGSLYGISSWQINREFLDDDLSGIFPYLDSPGRQLKGTINLLHLMGKSVGMDVIPHTDRFSEIVLANPRHFEWLRREDTTIVDHREDLHEEVELRILDYLSIHGDAITGAIPDIATMKAFFSEGTEESTRGKALFGEPADLEGRTARRSAIARHVYLHGYEPVPATMAPPYRGLTVDTERAHIDDDGHVWREYRIEKPESMSRVFGPLTRYKLYDRVDDNRNWEIDFDRPRPETWRYVQRHYAELQRAYGFDFMRGDMSHVQMRVAGVPLNPGTYYDLLGSVKETVQRENGVGSFGYFAETFIAPTGVMAYGDEIDHLEASGADVTLGDLQSRRVDAPEFVQQLRWYRDIGATRAVQPSFTVMTADKDDPRFDTFYERGNEARYFCALFLTDMPSYTGLNFECRDPHFAPAPNEHYTKLYVFHETAGPKATTGPFVFGHNGYLFYRVTRIRLFAEDALPSLVNTSVRWLLPPDATAGRYVVAWSYTSDVDDDRSRRFPVCVVNFGQTTVTNLQIPVGLAVGRAQPRLAFSTDDRRRIGSSAIAFDEERTKIGVAAIGPGEAMVIGWE